MSEQFDTSWFSLEKYAELKQRDLSEWLWQIELRQEIDYQLHDANSNLNIKMCEGATPKLIEFVNQRENDIMENRFDIIRDDPIHPRYDDSPPQDFDLEWRKDILSYSFNTYSVFSTPAQYVWDDCMSERLSYVWPICQKRGGTVTPEDIKITYTPIDTLIARSGIMDCQTKTHLTIDLTVTDEQIKEEFDYWLKHYREYSGYEAAKKDHKSHIGFTKADINNWVDYQLLAYLDLTLMAEFEKTPITTVKVANLIYPPDKCNISNINKRMAQTKSKAKWLIKQSTSNAIENQIRNETRRIKTNK